MHLFVSPHLDDAALSCGATIASLARRDDEVVVLTIFAGGNGRRDLAPYAARYHRKCGLADFWTRRWEDVEACACLGAGMVHLGFGEVLYRRDAAGRPRVNTRDDLFSPLTPEDHRVAADVAAELARWLRRLGPAVLYGPAGIGGHVDHVITTTAIRRVLGHLGVEAPPLLLYEEMPYAATPEDAALLATMADTAEPVIQEVTARDWRMKIRAVEAYRSQLRSIWKERDWRAALDQHARDVSGGKVAERLWKPN